MRSVSCLGCHGMSVGRLGKGSTNDVYVFGHSREVDLNTAWTTTTIDGVCKRGLARNYPLIDVIAMFCIILLWPFICNKQRVCTANHDFVGCCGSFANYLDSDRSIDCFDPNGSQLLLIDRLLTNLAVFISYTRIITFVRLFIWSPSHLFHLIQNVFHLQQETLSLKKRFPLNLNNSILIETGSDWVMHPMDLLDHTALVVGGWWYCGGGCLRIRNIK